ncbi:hypothetical protein AbraIFM66950_008007 [Aspergillus brasiliensis]|nr:hypothetical protein AbraIFM66950_008007 [Aspergillus brasiliensis]
MGDGPVAVFGDKKYLWGNVPAFDVLQLDRNEGTEYTDPMSVLFAASGDLRHVVKTIAELPSSFSRPIEITLNDRDVDIVARNAILLLVALMVDDADTAVDCMIHLWYSALIRESDLKILQQHVRPLINEVCLKTATRPPNTLLAKTWTFGRHTLRIILQKSAWNQLLQFLDVSSGLDAQSAQAVRQNITLAESRTDYRDRYLCLLSPAHRIAFHKFREDGLLVPFGYPRSEFQVPNPTLFKTGSTTWPMPDNADPRHSWPAEEVERTPSGTATADLYGKLFFYLRSTISSFLSRLRHVNTSFKLLHMDATSLPDHLEPESFSRIDVSNISDGGWLGIHRTLLYMIPLLQPPIKNPHATLITLFMNAIEETITPTDQTRDFRVSSQKILPYLPPKQMLTSPHDPQVIKFYMATDLVTDYEYAFTRYSERLEFQEAAALINAEMKNPHTIIKRWPGRLTLLPGQLGAQEEFDRCLGGGLSGKERYVEWRRTG